MPKTLKNDAVRRLRVVVFALALAGIFATPVAMQPAGDQRDIGALAGLSSSPIRVVVIGDFGEETSRPREGAKAVFDAIRSRHQRVGEAYDFGITVGDNFYPSGVRSRQELDERWKASGYASLNIRFYATLGNHDYRGNADAQVVSNGSTWNLPFPYYTFAAGQARFFALDTDEDTSETMNPFLLFGLIKRSWSKAQRDWVASALTTHAAATWKIVYGHHPVYSDGGHGNTGRLRKEGGLLDIMRERKVDLYIAGHDHDLQYHAPEGDKGIQFIVAGGSGRELRPITKKDAIFAASAFGFAELVIDAKTLTFRILGRDGKPLHEPKPLEKWGATHPGQGN